MIEPMANDRANDRCKLLPSDQIMNTNTKIAVAIVIVMNKRVIRPLKGRFKFGSEND